MARYNTPESLGHHLARVVKAYDPGSSDRVYKAAESTRARSTLHQEALSTQSPAEHPDFADLEVGERRIGSFASFFIDLSDFTARSVFEPVEQLADFTELVLSAYWDSVEGHGGYVLDIRGDGLLAGFGGVGAQANAEINRAVEAMAFCLRATRDTLNPELTQAGIHPTDVKVSGDWGDVLAIRIGNRINYLGSSLNVAAKLEKFADEFTLVVGDDLASKRPSAPLTPHPDSPYQITYGTSQRKSYPFFVVTWDASNAASKLGFTTPRRIAGGTDIGLLKKVPPTSFLGVTPDGRLVTSTALTSAVTAIAGHRFHHGAETESPIPGAAWWDVQPALLELERRHISTSFPTFEPFESEGRIGWRGTVAPWNREFKIEILWHQDRARLPRVRVTSDAHLGRMERGKWKRAPHLFDAGNLCLARPKDWRPSEYDATTVIAWAAHWLGCYEQWVAFKREWPRVGQGKA
jgi:class 3 adenylate cyclase